MKNQTFGIELETTGLGRARTAQVLAEHFGTVARHVGLHLDNWTVAMPTDGTGPSKATPRSTDPDAEVVSPVCRWKTSPWSQEVVRALRRAGAMTDESCGIHIHVGLGEHTPQSLRRLVNIVNAKEDLLTMALGISPERREQWCRPVEPRFLAQLNQRKPTSMEALARLWYTANGGNESTDWRQRASRHYDRSRYHLLNLHAAFSTERPAHTIEFRAFNGTLHAGEVKSYIQRCLAIKRAGRTPKRPAPRVPSQTTRNTPSAAALAPGLHRRRI